MDVINYQQQQQNIYLMENSGNIKAIQHQEERSHYDETFKIISNHRKKLKLDWTKFKSQ